MGKRKKLKRLIGEDYQIVYADPPYSYYGSPTKDQAAGKHYPLMAFERLAKLPVRRIMARDAVLFLWVTCPKLEEGINLIRHWDLYYRGVAYIWVKTTKSGKIINGQGVRPSFVKPTTELVLIGATKEKGRVFPLKTESQGQVLLHTRPGNVHSYKPPVVRKMITELLGNRKRIELFARQEVKGWDAWGNAIPKGFARNFKEKM